jgi:hypothetical protein
LSIASHSAVVRIPLTNVKGPEDTGVTCIKVGYMYEPNYGLVYLAIAPTICFLGFAALQSIQRWNKLAGAAKGNRLVFNRVVVAGLVLGGFGVTFGSEFMPYKASTGKIIWGDYEGLAFGYVQAHAIADYKVGEPIPAFRKIRSSDPHLNENTNLKVAEPPTGPHGALQVTIFYIFLATALTTQALYACVLWWILLKFIFVLFFILLAITKLPWLCPLFGADVALLNPLDDKGLFGLGPAMESLRYMLGVLSVAGFVNIVHFSTTQSMLGMRGPSGIGLVALVIALAFVPFYLVLTPFLHSYKQELLDEWHQENQREEDVERRKKREEEIEILKRQNASFLKELVPWKSGAAVLFLLFAALLHLPSPLQPKWVIEAASQTEGLKDGWQSFCESVVPCSISACRVPQESVDSRRI